MRHLLSSEQKTVLEEHAWGVPRGKYELFMRYAGQTFYTHLEGSVFDASSIFTGPDAVAQFKDLIFEELAVLAKPRVPESSTTAKSKDTATETNHESAESAETPDTTSLAIPDVQTLELTEIEKARVALENFDFASACRVLILEENISKTKHIIIQVGRLHTLAEYATYTPSRHWNFVAGQTSIGKVDGLGLTFPHEWKLQDLGKVTIHLFCPDDPRNSRDSLLKETLADAKALTAIIPWIPQALNVQAHLNALKAINRQHEDNEKQMSDELTAATIELNFYKIATAKTTPDGEPLPFVPQHGPSLTTIICYALPVLLFGVIGFAFTDWGWLFGVTFGLFTGAFADSKRR
jgi:hypothetical protein